MILRKRSVFFFLLAASLTAGGGCKDDDPPEVCTVGDASTCADGQVCEEVVGGDPACFAPVELKGMVFDAETDAGIGDAQVVALDASGEAVTLTATTDGAGDYSLTVPAARNADGTVADNSSVTLRVDADAYLAFPAPPRFAIPIDLTKAVDDGSGPLVVDNTVGATDVALFVLDAGAYGTIKGTISADAAGALVVAEQAGEAVATAIVGADGSFTLYNVPADVETTVTAYGQGVGSDTQTATVADGGTENVALTLDATGLATVTGDVNPVNAPNWDGQHTSVLLVVESTFNDLTKAGYMPAGLRDGSLSSGDLSFSIPDVPPGKYVVLAAFETDGLVRDPDLSQGNTSIRHIEVTDAGEIVSLVDPLSGSTESLTGIKVTDPLETVYPGATGLEIIDAAPTFQWSKDPGAARYEFRIFDAYGALVYEDLEVAQPGGSGPVSYVADGFVMEAGMIYQFRAASMDSPLPVDPGDTSYTLSTTEDLLGVFQYEPAAP